MTDSRGPVGPPEPHELQTDLGDPSIELALSGLGRCPPRATWPGCPDPGLGIDLRHLHQWSGGLGVRGTQLPLPDKFVPERSAGVCHAAGIDRGCGRIGSSRLVWRCPRMLVSALASRSGT